MHRRDIEREAYLWSDMGIYTYQQAGIPLRVEAEKPLMDAMFQAMHIIGREPVAAERQFVSACIEKGFPPETVALAMRRMEQNIGKFSLNYLKKILLLWHEKGVHTVPKSRRWNPKVTAAAQHPPHRRHPLPVRPRPASWKAGKRMARRSRAPQTCPRQGGLTDGIRQTDPIRPAA